MTDEILNEHGFKFSGTCHCDGFKTLKYRNGDYEIKWRINKYQFKLKKHGLTIQGWTSIKLLNEILEEKGKIILS